MECKKCGVELMILDRGPLLFENDERNSEGFSTRKRFILTIDENQPTQTGGFYIAPCAA